MQLKTMHAALLLCLTGCAVRQPVPPAWRYGERTLAPPGVATVDQAQSTVQLKLPGRGTCVDNDVLTIVRGKGSISLTVHREELLKQKPGWLAEWAGAAEAQGCIDRKSVV